MLHQVKTLTNEENQDLKKIHVILDQSQFFLFVRIFPINLKSIKINTKHFVDILDSWIEKKMHGLIELQVLKTDA